MLDIKFIRQNLDLVVAKLKKKAFVLDVETLQKLDQERKLCQVAVENLQQSRNAQAKAFGQLKARLKATGDDESRFETELKQSSDAMRANNEALDTMQAKLECIQNELQNFILSIPNLPDDSVPIGESEDDNQLIRTVGDIPAFDFPVQDHVALGTALKMLDFDAASNISGARFVVMKGPLARMQRALTQFMLDVHTANHYQEVYVPYIVQAQALVGTGQLPKFAADLFAIQSTDERQFYLIPTAEVPVTNLLYDKIVDEAELPLKYVAHTPCFRSEAGSYGKDTKGLIRQHQFEKVELVHIVKPEASYETLETLTANAESILQKLGLPYRVMSLCGSDLGFGSAKTYDLEVWLPGQQKYREISSCSNFEAFQARRIKARYRDKQTGKIELCHTLNGSGLAVGRTLVAIMENYQMADGSIEVPDALQKFMGGLKVINIQ